MTFVSSAGARIPHAKFVPIDIAVFSLPGGTHSATVAGVDSIGWGTGAGVPGTINKLGPGVASAAQNTWLTSLSVAAPSAPPGYVLYADALTKTFVIRATTVGPTPPATGGMGIWHNMTSQWDWLVNAGGSPGEVVTSTILLEIAEDVSGTPGPVLASGEYTMTITRS